MGWGGVWHELGPPTADLWMGMGRHPLNTSTLNGLCPCAISQLPRCRRAEGFPAGLGESLVRFCSGRRTWGRKSYDLCLGLRCPSIFPDRRDPFVCTPAACAPSRQVGRLDPPSGSTRYPLLIFLRIRTPVASRTRGLDADSDGTAGRDRGARCMTGSRSRRRSRAGSAQRSSGSSDEPRPYRPR